MNEKIDALFDLLDELRANNEMKYSAYSALHDKISFLSDSLKEQEPGKVLIRDDGEYCPHCSTITTRAMGLQKLHRGTTFCPYCGKGLIWDE